MKKPSKTKLFVVIPAGGVGTRYGGSLPKQYVELAGKPVIGHVIDRMLQIDRLSALVVAIRKDDNFFQKLPQKNSEKLYIAFAGRTRAESVLSCLHKIYDIGGLDCDWVLVQDSVRPIISRIECDCLLETIAFPECPGAILAFPVTDTIKKKCSKLDPVRNYESIDLTILRDQLWHAITPQAFRLGSLINAIGKAIKIGVHLTDESNAMELEGVAPWLVRGFRQNLKLTFPEDAKLIEILLQTNKF